RENLNHLLVSFSSLRPPAAWLSPEALDTACATTRWNKQTLVSIGSWYSGYPLGRSGLEPARAARPCCNHSCARSSATWVSCHAPIAPDAKSVSRRTAPASKKKLLVISVTHAARGVYTETTKKEGHPSNTMSGRYNPTSAALLGLPPPFRRSIICS